LKNSDIFEGLPLVVHKQHAHRFHAKRIDKIKKLFDPSFSDGNFSISVSSAAALSAFK